MTEEKVDLLTYCVLDEDGKNRVCPAPDEEGKSNKVFEEWEKRYVGSFKESYLTSKEIVLDVQKYYCDPDWTYKRGYDHSFFDHLTTFLNCQENALQKKLNGKFCYTFEQSLGIKVAKAEKPDEALFYLHSDQLGFSAPSNLKNHPYDLYLMKCKSSKDDEELKKVANWIARTRTIGGSFLWPGEPPWDQSFCCRYNKARGGTIKPWSNHYGQDRVDLALLDVNNWYSNNSEQGVLQDVLDGLSGNRESVNLETWLKHFKKFKTYVEFFCFEDFVDEESLPKCIFLDKSLPQSSKPEKPDITEDLSDVDLEKLLDDLSEKVVERSKAMLKKINNE